VVRPPDIALDDLAAPRLPEAIRVQNDVSTDEARRRAPFDEQRRFRIVVAHRDPRVANWLNTAGRQCGTIYWRHMLPEEPPERVSCRVVAFHDIEELEKPI